MGPSPPPTGADPRLTAAIELQLSGDVERATALYQELVDAAPDDAIANYCLGMARMQANAVSAALTHLARAVQLEPRSQQYWLGYLEALRLLGRFDEAATTLADARRFGLAGTAVEDYAQRLVREAAVLPPQAAPGIVTPERLIKELAAGAMSAALRTAQTLCRSMPASALAWKTLGVFHRVEGRLEPATLAMAIAHRLDPDDVEAASHLGAFYAEAKRFDEARTLLQRALRQDPGYALAQYRLGMCEVQQGRIADAIRELRRAVELHPRCDHSEIRAGQSNLLFALSHDPAMDGTSLFREHRRVGERIEAAMGEPRYAHRQSKDPARPLRIGFVSGDLHNHAVASFLEPVLPWLARRDDLTLFAYYNNVVEDALTARLKAHFDHWRVIHPMSGSDEALAEDVHRDVIDVLIDLSGHTGLNRLGTFALKPAPIQVSWLGYPGTTGLRTMDYYLADPHLLPRGGFEALFTEKLARISCSCPFVGHVDAPEVNALPASSAGRLTLASFNRAHKLNPATLAIWAGALRRVPDSRLLLGGIDPVLDGPRVTAALGALGVAPERILLRPRCAMRDYLAMHHDVDLCLDTFPYTGGTTTLHALWMGVPTLTIAGDTVASRQAASLMSRIGLHEFVVTDPQEVAARVAEWASNPHPLAAIRHELRGRWQAAPANDPRRVAGEIAVALREMWRRWCANEPATHIDLGASLPPLDPMTAPR